MSGSLHRDHSQIDRSEIKKKGQKKSNLSNKSYSSIEKRHIMQNKQDSPDWKFEELIFYLCWNFFFRVSSKDLEQKSDTFFPT